MSFFPISGGALVSFLVVISVFAATQCHADEQLIEVVGIGECADCKERKVQTNHAFAGLHVTIDCKNQFGTIERWGVGKLNEEGEFKISLPKEILKEGGLKHECYAQLHSASLAPCPAQNGLKSIKIVVKNDADGKHITFEPAQKLTFSTELCTSATFLPYHKPLPKLPKIGWKHHYKFPPLHKKHLPPMFPTPVPKPEPKKEEPKKKTPEKPKKEPKKQMPPVVKPPVETPPIVTPPVVHPPIVKPPIIVPPIEKPPTKKLPFPLIIPKLPPKDYHHPKLPPFPSIPPKYLHHPKLPHLPPSPHIPHT